ncbi:MAG: pyridoxamine 5'-phosphate oxidase family protein [Desulfobacterales bacterium]|mgnify:FL=1|jgi:nitroimidazol reductase NimA-like FMN-containing flavoprotein (pyridoxamine 5'-phosphate oxidase superfamily)|nr:pyridoxamine 5'-phosphate oxidase family protein [Deltaproteobacteria bacterium]
METSAEVQNRLRNLFESQRLAVVATQNGGQPYASLVAFVATDDLRHLFFVTGRTTRKFSNMLSDSRVAVLVNSSVNQESDFHEAISITATGIAEEIKDPERRDILKLYLSKHPYLEDFAKSPSCALIRVTARSYYMVQNFQNVMEFHIDR